MLHRKQEVETNEMLHITFASEMLHDTHQAVISPLWLPSMFVLKSGE